MCGKVFKRQKVTEAKAQPPGEAPAPLRAADGDALPRVDDVNIFDFFEDMSGQRPL